MAFKVTPSLVQLFCGEDGSDRIVVSPKKTIIGIKDTRVIFFIKFIKFMNKAQGIYGRTFYYLCEL
jgi:hypothetical protein